MKGTDIKLRLDDAGRKQVDLARHLGKSVHALNRLVHSDRELTASEISQVDTFFNDNAAPAAPATIRVPVYGYASATDGDRVSMSSDQILDHIELPNGMARGEIIAIRVAGDSMEPRLFSGEIVIVGRNVAPSRFGDCVVELRDGSGIVKQYRGSRDGYVFLHQYNPDKEIRLRADEVRAIHAVQFRR
jgi:phage repressor protein C with HTH and peptisase S24 domain